MKFGLHFGSRGVAGDPDSLKAVALKAEALGYGHFGMSDHVIVATDVESAYPYSKSGKFFAQDTGISLEQVTALSFVAAATSRNSPSYLRAGSPTTGIRCLRPRCLPRSMCSPRVG